MPLPSFTPTGDLPAGVHPATLVEVGAVFGSGSAFRTVLFGRVERVHSLAAATNRLARFILFGSYVSTKREPNDVDIFLLMDDLFDVSAVHGESRYVFDHGTAQAHFGCSIFWLRRLAALGGEEATIAQWQVKRDGSLRGIVEVIGP